MALSFYGGKYMEARKFAYARVSSSSQHIDRQIMELRKYVPEEQIVIDKASGKNLDREGYRALKGALGLRSGDSLYVTSLDRLSRNKNDIRKELEWFKENNIKLKVLDLPTTMVDLPEEQNWISDMINNILIEVLSSIAEQERLTIKKRQREGIDAAKAKGKHLGRPAVSLPAHSEKVFESWSREEITAKEAQKQLGVSSATFYRLVNRMGLSKKRDDI